MLYGEHNTIIMALETIEHLLMSASHELYLFLTSALSNPSVTPNFWSVDSLDTTSLEDKSETGSQLEAPCDYYFDLEDSGDMTTPSSTTPTPTTPSSTTFSTQNIKQSPKILHRSINHSGRIPSNTSLDSWTSPFNILSENACLTSRTSLIPLQDLIRYIYENILTHQRVSVKSAGLSVLSASLHVDHKFINDFSDLQVFFEAEDPKLLSCATTLVSNFIAIELKSCDRQFNQCRPLVGVACQRLLRVFDSDVSIVLKAACESLRLCLPLLLSCTQPNEGIKLLRKLINVIEVNYWLLKVELLQTLAVVDYAQLAVVEPSLLSVILEDIVFPLLSDSDHRVRTATCNTLTQLARTLNYTQQPLFLLAQQHIKSSFGHLSTKPAQMSLAGIGRVESQVTPAIPSCLESIVWMCTVVLGSSEDHFGQKGALEALCVLAEEYPPPTFPSMWSVNGSECGLLEMILQYLRGILQYVYEQMDGWTDGRTDGWTDGRMDGQMDGWTDGWMDRWTDGWTDG